MTSPDLPGLIDQLGAASLEARSLLADIRTATKDLRAATRESVAERERLVRTIKETVESDIKAEVSTQLTALGKETQDQMRKAVARVDREFDKLTNLLLTGDAFGRPQKDGVGLDLRALAAEQERNRTGGTP